MNNRNLAYDVQIESEAPTERVTLDADTLRFCAQLLEKRANARRPSRSPIAKALNESAAEIRAILTSPVVR
jgi:hypothetical protein